MTTLKALARKTELMNYSLAVVDEDGIVKDVLVENGCINDLVVIEKYFNYELLGDSQYLTRVMNYHGKHYFQVIDNDVPGGWNKIAA